ncbi:TolC family outer membrane protein [Malikia sp.]|uniref:TolC family outer membrane protein n=1 Tax=Malikia sp. TaxID=2070706 RepID=UPI0026145CDA|nr:TolC family outer membrane protein [Malikia sp.]MDD2728997.1 TolC family outer membrane protein [Malikia sp.]
MKQRLILNAGAGAVLALTGSAVLAQALPTLLVAAAQKAVVSNPEVQARWREFNGAGADREAGTAGYKPQVDMTLGVGLERKDASSAGSETDYTRAGGELRLTQMLFDGMYTRSELKRLGYAKLVRYYELIETSENISLEALRAYADVARHTELVEEARSNYLEHKSTALQIWQKASAGVGRRVDLEQANGRIALAESNLLTEQSNLHDVSARYLRIMGEKPLLKIARLPDGLKLQGLPTSAIDALQRGLPSSPTINAAYENVRASRAQVESRQSAYWPRVDFRIRESWGRSTDSVAGRQRDQVAEVLLNYNLYRGGYDQAREKRAVEYQFQARDLQEKACRDVRQTLSIAYQDMVKLKEQLGYLDTHRLSTEKALQAYRQQFEIGQRSLLDLLDTQNELFEANRAHINARYDQIIAQARTLSGMGKLTAALGIGRPGQPSLQDAGQDRHPQLPLEELCPLEAPETVQLEKKIAESRSQPVSQPAQISRTAPTRVTFLADALFDFDKAVLKPAGQSQLNNMIGQIKGLDIEIIIVIGHTDSIGTDAYNQKLSERRANAVKTYLVNQGISAGKVSAEGRGKSTPLVSNSTAEGRAKNRRIEMRIIPAGYQATQPKDSDPVKTPVTSDAGKSRQPGGR